MRGKSQVEATEEGILNSHTEHNNGGQLLFFSFDGTPLAQRTSTTMWGGWDWKPALLGKSMQEDARMS